MADRDLPPIPGKKPPVPLDFKLKQLFGGSGMALPIPPLSFTGGAAGPATSGGIGEQGNIGAVNLGGFFVNQKTSFFTTVLYTVAALGAVWFITRK